MSSWFITSSLLIRLQFWFLWSNYCTWSTTKQSAAKQKPEQTWSPAALLPIYHGSIAPQWPHQSAPVRLSQSSMDSPAWYQHKAGKKPDSKNNTWSNITMDNFTELKPAPSLHCQTQDRHNWICGKAAHWQALNIWFLTYLSDFKLDLLVVKSWCQIRTIRNKMPECIMMVQTVLVQRWAFRFEIAGISGCQCCRRAGVPGPVRRTWRGTVAQPESMPNVFIYIYIYLNKFPASSLSRAGGHRGREGGGGRPSRRRSGNSSAADRRRSDAPGPTIRVTGRRGRATSLTAAAAAVLAAAALAGGGGGGGRAGGRWV